MFALDIVICVNVNHSVNERNPSGTVRLQRAEIKKVEDFKYFGSTLQSNGECGKEVKKQRKQAAMDGEQRQV